MACRIGVGIDKLFDGVSLVDAFSNKLLAFLSQNHFKFSKDCVSKHSKNLYLTLEQKFQCAAAISERLVDGCSPSYLGGKNNDLAGIGIHKCIQSLTINLFRFKDRSVLINSLSKELSESRLHSAL